MCLTGLLLGTPGAAAAARPASPHRGALPDLTITTLQWRWDCGTNRMRFGAEVYNAGTADAAAPFRLRFKANQPLEVVGIVTINGLGVGEKKWGRVAFVMDNPSDEVTIVRVDPGDRIEEFNEDNNARGDQDQYC
jgi:CARDB protein